MLRFLSLCSGSSGNCYYLGTEQYAILIDSGIGGRSIRKVLKENNLLDIPIRALLITHDHTDHIRGASMVSSMMDCPVYTTKVRHDSYDNVGYYIEWREGEEAVRFCLVTDCGKVTEEVLKYTRQADHLVLESNHDVEMLENGSYPHYLKLRVRGEGGHLSNDECADVLKQVYHQELKHVFLCHLSADNNTPDKAFQTASRAIREKGGIVGVDGVTLVSLPRTEATLVYQLSE